MDREEVFRAIKNEPTAYIFIITNKAVTVVLS